jgi:hypothetical protein
MGVLAIPTAASAQSWEVRREVREGGREVVRERRESMGDLRRCNHSSFAHL